MLCCGMGAVVRVDGRGRIVIPKDVRRACGIGAGDLVLIEVRDGEIVVRRVGGVAERYYGVFKVERWPEDLDELLVEAVGRGWKGHT